MPAPELQSDIISITGLANHLDRAKEGLLERVKELTAEQEDRVRVALFTALLHLRTTVLKRVGLQVNHKLLSLLPSHCYAIWRSAPKTGCKTRRTSDMVLTGDVLCSSLICSPSGASS